MKTQKTTQRTLNFRHNILTITQSNEVQSYHVEEVKTSLDGRTFRLNKFIIDQRDENDAVYFVHQGETHSCDCQGHRRWGHRTVCRHQAAVRKLVELGKI